MDSWPTTAVGPVSYQRFIAMGVGKGFFRCLQGTCQATESSKMEKLNEELQRRILRDNAKKTP